MSPGITNSAVSTGIISQFLDLMFLVPSATLSAVASVPTGVTTTKSSADIVKIGGSIFIVIGVMFGMIII
jgi:hypothetical protein